MALKNFTQFTPQTVLSATDFIVGYRQLDEIRTDLSSLTDAISGLLVAKGFTPGGTVGSVKRIGYRYTIGSSNNLNAVSGADDYNAVLDYVPQTIEVYRNGSHLVQNLDFIANNGTQITNLSTMNLGDVVEVSVLSGIPVTITNSVSTAGAAFIISYRYTVNIGNTIVPDAIVISGSDDYSNVLRFTSPNLQVYLNGSQLIRDVDYGLYSNGNTLTLNDPVTSGDVLDIIALSGYALTTTSGITSYSNLTNVNRGKNILVSQSSGVVTISAKSDICSEISLDDIPVPGWTDGQHISRFSLLQDYLSAVAATNTSPASAASVEVFGTISGSVPLGPANESGVLAPNGKIYLAPRNGSLLSVIDPSTNTISVINSTFPGGAAFYTGGVLAPNGKIYLNQAGISVGRVIDPATNTVSTPYTFSGITTSINGQFIFVVAPNGRLYGMPLTGSSLIRMVDPATNVASNIVTLGAAISGGTGLLAPNGKILFTATGTAGYAFDPNSNTIGTLNNFSMAFSGQGGAILHQSGYIVTLSGNGATPNLLKYDPNNDTTTTIAFNSGPAVPTGSPFACSILSPNGKIYAPPYDATIGFIIDVDNLRLTTYGNNSVFPGSQAFWDGICHPNGKIYFFPSQATSCVAVNTLNNNNWNINVCTNPFFNKY